MSLQKNLKIAFLDFQKSKNSNQGKKGENV